LLITSPRLDLGFLVRIRRKFFDLLCCETLQLEAELEASRTAFDAATAAKVNAEKSAKSALANAKKAEKDLATAKKEHLQRE
jgi:hypothetical protein